MNTQETIQPPLQFKLEEKSQVYLVDSKGHQIALVLDAKAWGDILLLVHYPKYLGQSVEKLLQVLDKLKPELTEDEKAEIAIARKRLQTLKSAESTVIQAT